MPNPLLTINSASDFVFAMNKITKKKAKEKKKTKVKKAKVKKVKAVKEEEAIRESPLCKGDDVWVKIGSKGYLKTKILKCCKPDKIDRTWSYNTQLNPNNCYYECDFIPAKIFTMIATDVNRMIEPNFIDHLNSEFDEEIMCLSVYRQGQSRPWAYYIIPDKSVLYKELKWKTTHYGYNQDKTITIFTKPAKEITLQLIPISSAPQEILTYLGNRIYNRKWKSETKD